MGLPGDAVVGACFDKAGGGFLVAGALPLLDVVALGAAVVAIGNARSGDIRVAALGSSRAQWRRRHKGNRVHILPAIDEWCRAKTRKIVAPIRTQF